MCTKVYNAYALAILLLGLGIPFWWVMTADHSVLEEKHTSYVPKMLWVVQFILMCFFLFSLLVSVDMVYPTMQAVYSLSDLFIGYKTN